MHDYSEVRQTRGHTVNQTLDSPIMIFDTWELSEIFAALAMILIFGIAFYLWVPLCVFLVITLVGLPYIRKRFNKGMALHYPYKKFGMSLPGLLNPKGRSHVSD